MPGKRQTEPSRNTPVWGQNKAFLIFLLAVIAAVILGAIIYLAFGHRVVASMYRGESIEFLNKMIEGRSVTPLEEYFQRSDTYFLLLICYLLLFAVTLAVIFIKHELRFGNRVFVALVSIVLLTASFLMKPKLLGDGPEYYVMTESLCNHLSPDLRQEDINSIRRIEDRFSFPIFYRNPSQYYYPAKNGRLYSYHFWAYPLLNVPVKLVLRLFRLNEAKVFQITNALLLILALLSVTLLSRFNENGKRMFNLLMVFSPAFWFISWTHPEMFSYAFVILALVFMHKGNHPAAVVSASISSMQNQPLLFFMAYVWIHGLINSKERLKDFFFLSAAALPSLLPNIFFYHHFNTLTLLGREAANISNASLFKASEMFFDLNMGMLPYVPLTLILFLGMVIKDTIYKRKPTQSFFFLILMIIMMLSCTTTNNWNHGTTGPFRYVIWMLPLMFYVLTERIPSDISKRSAYSYALVAAVIIQVFIVTRVGGLRPPLTQVRNTAAARFVLNHFPSLYNPSPEIFSPRVGNPPDSLITPAVYRYRGKCRKVLVRGRDMAKLEELCGGIPESKQKFFLDERNKDKFTYINY